MWLACAEPSGLGMGLGFGLIISSVFTKMFFAPTIAYGQVMGIKMKLLQPDQDESMAAAKRYQQQGNREAAKIERGKLK